MLILVGSLTALLFHPGHALVIRKPAAGTAEPSSIVTANTKPSEVPIGGGKTTDVDETIFGDELTEKESLDNYDKEDGLSFMEGMVSIKNELNEEEDMTLNDFAKTPRNSLLEEPSEYLDSEEEVDSEEETDSLLQLGEADNKEEKEDSEEPSNDSEEPSNEFQDALDNEFGKNDEDSEQSSLLEEDSEEEDGSSLDERSLDHPPVPLADDSDEEPEHDDSEPVAFIDQQSDNIREGREISAVASLDDIGNEIADSDVFPEEE